MREVVLVVFGIAVGLAWMAIWTGLLHVLGIAPVRRKAEDRRSTRERLKRLGKLKCIMIFGVIGPGVAFALAVITIDLANHRSASLASEVIKFALFAVVFGLIRGLCIGIERFVIRSRFHLPIRQRKAVDVTSRFHYENGRSEWNQKDSQLWPVHHRSVGTDRPVSTGIGAAISVAVQVKKGALLSG